MEKTHIGASRKGEQKNSPFKWHTEFFEVGRKWNSGKGQPLTRTVLCPGDRLEL